MVKEKYDYMKYLPESFDVGEYELGNLTLDAALAIDNYLIDNGHYNRHKRALIRTGRILYTATQPDNSHPSRGWVIAKDDPSACVVLARVFKVYDGKGLETVDEVVQRTREVGFDILNFEKNSREKQEELRGFCLELSKSARNYWHSRNPHGFKRCVA